MRARTRAFVIVLALAATLASDGRFISAGAPRGAGVRGAASEGRVRFRITTVEESGGESRVVSDATVEGPPSTDFDVNLQLERFKMSARFLTDLTAPGSLKMRARLDTRRFYGYSEQKLPLYEEDVQSETLQLGFDESVVLLPFGRAGGGDRLKIEITPEVVEPTAAAKPRPLEINIIKPAPGGSVYIEARKVPHRFFVEALLLEDGREVARGASDFLIEEAQELLLRPNAQAGPEVSGSPLAVRLTVNQFTGGRPADFAAVAFDLYSTDQQGTRRDALGRNWAGVGELGSNVDYDLSRVYMKGSGKKYELRFRISLAAAESAD